MGAACSAACGYCGACTAAWERDDESETCPDCAGSGEIVREDGSEFRVVAECLECHGTGEVA